MLCQFSFQNFKSYKGETTLDFQAATLPEFKETLITEEKAMDLLPISVKRRWEIEPSPGPFMRDFHHCKTCT